VRKEENDPSKKKISLIRRKKWDYSL